MQIFRPYPDPLNQEFCSVSQQAVFLKVAFDIHSKFKNHPRFENQLVSCVRSMSCDDVCCYRPILNPRPLVKGRVSVPYYRSNNWLNDKVSAWNAEDTGDFGSIPGLGRSLGEGNDNPFQYSCLENPMHSKLGGLQSIQLQRFGYNLSDLAHKRTEVFFS